MQQLPVVMCPDCGYVGEVEISQCEIHEDCEDFAYCCSNCSSLNVDFEAKTNEKI